MQEQSFKKLLPWNGLELVYEAQVSLAQPDYTSEVLQAKGAGADVILTLVDSQSVIRIAQAAHRQGWNVQLAGTYNLEQDLILPGAKDLEGLILTAREGPYQSSPKLKDYRDAMAQYQPGAAMGDLGAGVFVVGKMLAKLSPAMARRPSPADMLKSLYSLHGEKLDGLLPRHHVQPGRARQREPVPASRSSSSRTAPSSPTTRPSRECTRPAMEAGHLNG